MSTQEKTVKPNQCVLAFGIPTDKESFFSDLKNPNKDFAKNFYTWSKYNREVVSELNAILPKLSRSGIVIKQNLTLDEFKPLFDKYEVVILFSHWKKEKSKIEFYDGLVDYNHIASLIPDDYSGVIDLSVCSQTELALLIRKTKSKDLICIYNQKEAIPFVWLNFYAELFKHLKEMNTTYLNAFNIITSKFIKS
ncbi:hypothetical protein GCM10011344_33780 [Dokdonia pacifica]|uniref:Uncharacterized protein n=1 Tax=Dokdonia pacifica TaxID=1627892 RepID=A0A239BCG1_9FLAO|nr:hypothetical protein [Dokdonia pacifica]GGG30110.1 hypothetical protein GCM10011344_33780 [Dokdonia pacifica]SNS05610.1 hypothetical protein SAMN06265376_10676 [Dokdonia pacifica]